MTKKLNCVLLVDDNESDNYIHKRVLEKSGITDFIEVAENGKEALDFLTTKRSFGQKESSFPRPSLIFLDINMPVINGWEFLEEYQKLDDAIKGKVVIIMLTTSLNPTDLTKTEKKLGGKCFQYKPLTLKMINEIMLSHFPDYL